MLLTGYFRFHKFEHLHDKTKLSKYLLYFLRWRCRQQVNGEENGYFWGKRATTKDNATHFHATSITRLLSVLHTQSKGKDNASTTSLQFVIFFLRNPFSAVRNLPGNNFKILLQGDIPVKLSFALSRSLALSLIQSFTHKLSTRCGFRAKKPSNFVFDEANEGGT